MNKNVCVGGNITMDSQAQKTILVCYNKKNVCKWKYFNNYYKTECGNIRIASPKIFDNICPGCGKPIEEVQSE